jgi:replicative DNA helicase
MKQPNAIDLEVALLGTLLMDRDSIISVYDILSPEAFYKESHKNIYRSIKGLFEQSQPIDVLTVMQDLKQKGYLDQSGGMTYLSELINHSTFGIDHHARIITQKFMQRELITISSQLMQDAQDETIDVFELLDNANNALLKAQNVLGNDSIVSLEIIKNRLLKMALGVKLGTIKSNEIPTCVNFIKLYTNTVTVLGAKPGTGKTAFLLSSANAQAEAGYRIMILSLEMTKERMTARIIQSKTSIFAKRLISGDIKDDEYNTISDTHLSDNILIEEGIGWNSQNFKARLVALYKKYKFDVCYLDYFQKIPLMGKDSVVNSQFYLMENQLCGFVKEYPVAMCLLSQLTRGEKSDLESLRGGGIEQGAQQVYIMTDEYLNENKNLDWNDIPESRRGKISVSCEKNRDDSYMGGDIYFDKLKQTMTNWKWVIEVANTNIF